jgi:hypothetical protein
MKKSVMILFAFLSAIFLSSFVLAAVPIELPAAPQLPAEYGAFAGLVPVVKGLINGIAGTINYALGGAGFGDIAFAKFLLFILLVIIIYEPSKLIVKNKGMAFVVSLIISTLGLYTLPDSVIAGILLPYNTVGVVVSVLVPLAALTYFLNTFAADLRWLRKTGWILAAVTFIGLLTFRMADTSSAKISGVIALCYGLAAAACIGFFFFDGTIQTWFRTTKLKRKADRDTYVKIAELESRLTQLVNARNSLDASDTVKWNSITNSIDDTNNNIAKLYKTIK